MARPSTGWKRSATTSTAGDHTRSQRQDNEQQHRRYQRAIPAESFARAVAFAMSQADDVDVNEILFRPTQQQY
jgi:NADP-dependent 3-hydroxy acid dehydrogenase YdfG